jgi:hypothetical protein
LGSVKNLSGPLLVVPYDKITEAVHLKAEEFELNKNRNHE